MRLLRILGSISSRKSFRFPLGTDTFLYVFSGADLAALVREAYVKALKERMRAEETGIRLSSTVVIAKKHFELAFERVKPSVQPKVTLDLSVP